LGILRQSRKQRALARDERERRELRWLATTQIAGTLAFVIAMQVGVFMDGAWLPILLYVLFSAVITVLALVACSNLARRLAVEVLEDSSHAPERHPRDRRKAVPWNIQVLTALWIGAWRDVLTIDGLR
jgi:hypothetical protein